MGNYDYDLDLNTINTQSIIANWIDDNSRVLELGPANGRLTKYLNQSKKCTVDIVEIDEESGAQAAKYADKSFVGQDRGDIQKYHWIENEKYDYIVISDVLEHLNNPGEVLEKCKCVLSDSGKILISVPNIAHGSVMIDLINGKFDYQKTGLLDSTHIHFFTFKSLLSMIHSKGLSIDELVPIYSRVGENEIENSYDDVNGEIERELRQLQTSGIYQFVCKIGVNENDEVEKVTDVEPFKQESFKPLELLIYYKASNQEYSDDRVLRKYYNASKNMTFRVELPGDVTIDNIRINPMSSNGIVELVHGPYINGDKKQQLERIGSSCKYSTGDIYYFENEFPNIEFAIGDNTIAGNIIEFEIKVWEYRISPLKKEEYEKIFTAVGNEINDVAEKYNKQFSEQAEYNVHLERDIAELKQYVNHLETDIAGLKEYIESVQKR